KFTARINDLRGNSIRSVTTIKRDICLLKDELIKLKIENINIDKHLAKVQSAYIATMIIRRLEDTSTIENL
ncbi:hypothetical protein CGH58_25725, partial [Vibrio parahaemolyticus]|uniref:hypothetical protein n=1 Tax=Vibrio parahaemolyticus TaxID=670 RepID=UPI00117390C2